MQNEQGCQKALFKYEPHSMNKVNFYQSYE